MSDPSSQVEYGTSRWLITITVMLVAVLEVLDMTIVNVSLPSMMGSLGASADEITWVLTSYIVSAAIFMPLTGFLVARFGQRHLLFFNIIGFGLASALCGISSSLFEIVLFRTLQGIFGAGLVPLSQVIMRNTFSKEEMGTAMAIWGVGIMTGPVLGPTLGGYITEYLSWQWVFYINIPICVVALLMGFRHIKDSPRRHQPIDWLGMALLAISIGCLQIFLDRGNSVDWFASNSMVILTAIWVGTLIIFVVRGWNHPHHIINLHLFADMNFSICTLLTAVFVMGILGVVSLQPILMENIMGYPAETTGLLMAPRGIASAIGMAMVAIIINRIPHKYIVAFGMLLCVIGTYCMAHFQIDTSESTIVWLGVLQGFGMGLFFVPIAAIAFNHLPEESTPEAAGLYSFGRSLGTSIGISIFSTMITRLTQINWHEYASHITPFDPNLKIWLNHHGWTIHQPQALGALTQEVAKLAGMKAFTSTFLTVAIIYVCLLPVILMLPKVTVGKK